MRGNIWYCIRIDMAYDCSSIKVKVGNDQETLQSEIPTQNTEQESLLSFIAIKRMITCTCFFFCFFFFFQLNALARIHFDLKIF